MQSRPQSNAKILIVDDDTILASLYRIKLQGAGFQVEVAESGETGLLKISQSAPDVVVLDLMLGDMNGVEVLEMLRRNPTTQALPVIVFSSAFLGNLVDDAMKAGATKALNKANCPPNRLIEEIDAILQPRGPGADALRESIAAAAAPVRIDPRSVAPPRPPAFAGSAPTRAPPPGGPPKPPTQASPAGDDDMQGSLRRNLLEQVRQRIEDANRALPQWLKNPRNLDAPYFGAMYRAIRAIAGSASLAGRLRLGHLASGLEALLREVKRAPAELSGTVHRTVALGVGLLAELGRGDELQTESTVSPLIVIVDEDPESRRSVLEALEAAQLHPLAVGDLETARRLVEWNRFDLAVFHLDRGSGVAFAARLAENRLDPATPIIVIADTAEPEILRDSQGIGVNDLITRPVNPVELGVKALATVYGKRT
jgi:CheY-like chemotaxis protein